MVQPPRESVRSTVERSVYGGLRPMELTDRGVVPARSAKDHWGWHLIADASGCNDNIDDAATVKEFLETLVDQIGMRPIGKPLVIRVDSEREGRGISAVQIIETSTITAHFDDADMRAFIDIFSCAEFDPQAALDHVKKYFEPQRLAPLWLYRDAGGKA